MLLCLPLIANGQEASSKVELKAGSIILVECKNCGNLLIRPTPKYPAYVGFGPHVWRGTVGIQVRVNRDGTVSRTKAIFGHPYFRPYLESESLAAKFRPGENSSNVQPPWVLVYEVTPPSIGDGVINGVATYLPKPVASTAAVRACASGEVRIAVLIDEKGDVVNAKGLSGEPLLMPLAIRAARQAKFRPPDSSLIRIRGVLVYRFPKPPTC